MNCDMHVSFTPVFFVLCIKRKIWSIWRPVICTGSGKTSCDFSLLYTVRIICYIKLFWYVPSSFLISSKWTRFLETGFHHFICWDIIQEFMNQVHLGTGTAVFALSNSRTITLGLNEARSFKLPCLLCLHSAAKRINWKLGQLRSLKRSCNFFFSGHLDGKD